MPRPSQREAVTEQVRAYLARGEVLSAEECPLHVRNVAAALQISPTTLYKYELDMLIGEARERQQQRAKGQKKTVRAKDASDRLRYNGSKAESLSETRASIP